MTVDEMLARMTSTELVRWAAYEKVAGPLGPVRADVQAAIVASTIANANRGKKGRKFSLKDFLPRWDRKQQQSWQEQLAAVKALNAAFGGTDETSGGDGGGGSGPAPGEARRRFFRRRTRD